MSDERYTVNVESIFEGPMDLLIFLIRKHEVDIYDIPIALITDQYLKYLELLKALNIDLAGEFLVMAATLTQIKSKMLLPIHGVGDDGEAEDPRQALTQPLLEYLQMKAAAEDLAARDLLGEHTFARRPPKAADLVPGEERDVKVGLFELIDAFQRILDRVGEEHRVSLKTDRISVQERIDQLVETLETRGSATFTELFVEPYDKSDIVVTFLALLEMVRLGLVRLTQSSQTGIIRLFYV